MKKVNVSHFNEKTEEESGIAAAAGGGGAGGIGIGGEVPAFIYQGKSSKSPQQRRSTEATLLNFSGSTLGGWDHRPSAASTAVGGTVWHCEDVPTHDDDDDDSFHGPWHWALFRYQWWCHLLTIKLMPFQHRRRRRRATDQDKGWPIVFTYVMVVAVLCIMSGELILNREVSGEFFEADPFNYMLGPSVQTLIQTGARYVPCMRNTTTMPSDERYVCLRRPVFSTNGKDGARHEELVQLDENTVDEDGDPSNGMRLFETAIPSAEAATGAASDGACTLEDVCGMGGFVSYDAQLLRPDQSFRFFTPLFVHSGLVSLAANLVLHVHIGLALEAVMNGVRLAFVYFVTGVFGNLFGATFATVTAPSTGCSPAILGMVGCLLVDLVYTWRTFLHPWLQLLRITLLTALCFGLGLLPGVDSFTNLGGYISGLLIGVWAVPAVHYNRRFTVGVWVVRITCLAGIVTLFSLLTLNFYRPDDFDEFCPYCRYISCLPVSGSCDQEDYY